MHKKPRSKFPRIVILVVLIFLPLILVGWFYVQRGWDGTSRYTIIELDPQVRVKSFDPVSNSGMTFVFPENLEIETVGGRGKWQVKSLDKAGTNRWAAESLADALGIDYHAVGFIGNLWDKFMWSNKTKSARWQEVILENTIYLEKTTTPDKLEIFLLSSWWDNQARVWFLDQNIAQEGIGVIIVNTVNYPGLGANAARIISSLGPAVRGLENSDEAFEKCLLRGEESLMTSLTAVRLLSIFNCSWEASDDSDLRLYLGQDYLKWKWGI